METVAKALVLLVALVCSSARADSFSQPLNYRTTDPTGTYYVVVNADSAVKATRWSRLIGFEIARRKAGTSRVTAAVDYLVPFTLEVVRIGRESPRWRYSTQPGKTRSRLIQNTGVLERPWIRRHRPRRSRLGEPANVYALTIVTGDGVVRHRKKLTALFDEQDTPDYPGRRILFLGTAAAGSMRAESSLCSLVAWGITLEEPRQDCSELWILKLAKSGWVHGTSFRQCYPKTVSGRWTKRSAWQRKTGLHGEARPDSVFLRPGAFERQPPQSGARPRKAWRPTGRGAIEGSGIEEKSRSELCTSRTPLRPGRCCWCVAMPHRARF